MVAIENTVVEAIAAAPVLQYRAATAPAAPSTNVVGIRTVALLIASLALPLVSAALIALPLVSAALIASLALPLVHAVLANSVTPVPVEAISDTLPVPVSSSLVYEAFESFVLLLGSRFSR